jgi:protein-disulfide isomerase
VSTRKSRSSSNRNRNYIVGAVVAALVVAGAVIGLSIAGGGDGSSPVDDETVAGIQQKFEGIPADGLVLGEPGAPVTITEYSDIACIHCRTAALERMPAVIDEVVRDGSAKLEFVPAAFISASSERGALGVLAAAEQDASWPFSEVLFEMQGNAASDWLSDEDMEAVAGQLGMDVEAWKAAYTGAEVEAAFIVSRDAVQTAGVASTPTFIITGPGGTERIEGAVPAQQLIDAVEKVSTPS